MVEMGDTLCVMMALGIYALLIAPQHEHQSVLFSSGSLSGQRPQSQE